MNSNFDEAIEEQVNRFNQRLAASASRQKRLVKALCIERMLDDYALLQAESIATAATSSSQPAIAVGVVREQLGEMGRWVLRRVIFPHQERQAKPRGGDKLRQVVIEGQYVVISTAEDISNVTRSDKKPEITKREEKDNGQG